MINNKHSLILLDLGNVLVEYHPEKFARQVEQKCSIPAMEIIDRYCYGEFRAEFERGQKTELEFFSEMMEWLQWPVMEFAQLTYLWSEDFQICHGAVQAIENLKEHYPLWLLSDTNITHRNFCRIHFPFLNHLSKTFVSFETGMLKTDPGAFERILAETDVPPERILFLDDLPKNIDKARQVGIDAHVFKDWQSIKEIISF
ncbi:MAG: HAD family phosphatase [Calditrichaeota bacterium]|nr:HAD family phosphatase [Calditrichota bacterium]